MQAELCHKEAVDQADNGADSDDGEQSDKNPEAVDLGQAAEHLIGEVRLLQEHTGDGGSQADHTSGGKVGTGEHDTAANAQRQRQICRHLGNQVGKGAPGQELVSLGGRVDDENQHQDVQGVIEDAVHNGTPLVLCVLDFEFFSGSAKIRYRISHFLFPP